MTPDYFKQTGKSLDEDLKAAGFAIDYIGECSRSYLRQMVRKQCVLVMLNHLRRENRPTTFDRNARKIMNEAGYYHLSEAARQMGVTKQWLSRTTTSLPETATIEVGGRLFYFVHFKREKI